MTLPWIGILFDEMKVRDLHVDAAKNLLDLGHDRSMRIMYGQARIPARTPRIFTCNAATFADFIPHISFQHPEDLAALSLRCIFVQIQGSVIRDRAAGAVFPGGAANIHGCTQPL